MIPSPAPSSQHLDQLPHAYLLWRPQRLRKLSLRHIVRQPARLQEGCALGRLCPQHRSDAAVRMPRSLEALRPCTTSAALSLRRASPKRRHSSCKTVLLLIVVQRAALQRSSTETIATGSCRRPAACKTCGAKAIHGMAPIKCAAWRPCAPAPLRDQEERTKHG